MTQFERFVFRPNHQKGGYEYSGQPCATQEIFDRIGQEGIDKIHAEMKLMLEMRKKMYGCFNKGHYGFSSKEVFYDLESATTIKLLADPSKKTTNVELHSPALLNNEDSYLITRSIIKDDMGKIAFKNHVQATMSSDFGYISRKEKIEEAVKQVKWLKENSISKLTIALAQ